MARFPRQRDVAFARVWTGKGKKEYCDPSNSTNEKNSSVKEEKEKEKKKTKYISARLYPPPPLFFPEGRPRALGEPKKKGKDPFPSPNSEPQGRQEKKRECRWVFSTVFLFSPSFNSNSRGCWRCKEAGEERKKRKKKKGGTGRNLRSPRHSVTNLFIL